MLISICMFAQLISVNMILEHAMKIKLYEIPPKL